jgi:hypothetical protein
MYWLYANDYPAAFGVYEVHQFLDEDEDEMMLRIEGIIYQRNDSFDIDELVVQSDYDYSRISEDEREVIQHLMSGGKE